MAASDTKSTSKKQKAKRGKGSMLLILLAAAIPILIVGVIGWWLFGGGRHASYQSKIESYLEDKYSQEFKVGKITVSGGSLGSPGLRVGTAHPISDKSLQFQAGVDPDTGVFFDGYSRAVWVREETPKLEEYLMHLYSSSSIPKIDLVINIPTPNSPDPIRGEVPTLSDALTKYANKMNYSLTLNTTPQNLDNREKTQQKDNLRAVVNRIKDYNYGMYSVRLQIIDPNDGSEYLCSVGSESKDIDKVLSQCLDEPWIRRAQ